jgi:adenylate kinase family enzyme
MSKEFIIIRGISGSGKSTLAKELAGDVGVICSADDYFIDDQGNYKWTSGAIQDAHHWNSARIKKALFHGLSPVIMDNTNITKRDLKAAKHLIEYAIAFEYDVRIEEVKTPWAFNVEELVKKNTHKLDERLIQRQVDRWVSNVTVDDILNYEK